jgi:hypothetical protein
MADRAYHRARIEDPGRFRPDSFRSKWIADGVLVVVGKRPRARKTEAQAILFDKAKFTPDDARAWIHTHGYTAKRWDWGNPDAMIVNNPDVARRLREHAEDLQKIARELQGNPKRQTPRETPPPPAAHNPVPIHGKGSGKEILAAARAHKMHAVRWRSPTQGEILSVRGGRWTEFRSRLLAMIRAEGGRVVRWYRYRANPLDRAALEDAIRDLARALRAMERTPHPDCGEAKRMVAAARDAIGRARAAVRNPAEPDEAEEWTEPQTHLDEALAHLDQLDRQADATAEQLGVIRQHIEDAIAALPDDEPADDEDHDPRAAADARNPCAPARNAPPVRQLVQLGDVLELRLSDGRAWTWGPGERAMLVSPGIEKDSAGRGRIIVARLVKVRPVPEGKGPHKTSERTYETWAARLPKSAEARIADVPGPDEFNEPVGRLASIVYRSDKWQTRRRGVSYVHDFGPDKLPQLVAGPRGSFEIRGGAFRVTARGIVG